MPCYWVGDQRFQNRWSAMLHANATQQKITFDLFQQEFDRADWTHEPDQTWDQLLDRRALQIAAKNKPIILAFSGGTDSYTMYQVFRRMDIPIAGAYVMIKHRWQESFDTVIKFITAESQQHGFRLWIGHETPDVMSKIYDSPDWLWNNQRNLSVYFGFGCDVVLHAEDSVAAGLDFDGDYVMVTGNDKPRLLYANYRYYSYQQDWTYHASSDPRIEYFYIHGDLPDLHIKQSYMLARWITQRSKELGISKSKLASIHENMANRYLDYSINGCGRFGDLCSSAEQKRVTTEAYLVLPENAEWYQARCNGHHSVVLENGIKTGSTWAKNYIQGLMQLRSDSIISDSFQDLENLHSVRKIHSRPYALQISQQG
jgi:hypothetical protein